MKYKLIKEYPGSPKLGNTIDNLENDWIENYPEFWELVVEKDYEILSLIEGKFIYPCDKYGEDFINQLFNTLGVSIHSVKRLSDEEIFNVSDDVLSKTCNVPNRILSIKLINNKIRIYPRNGFYNLNDIKKVKKPLFKTEDGVDIFEGDNIYWVNINTFEKINCNKYNDDLGEISIKSLLSKKYECKAIAFSTKEKAEEYIIMNKPVLSLNDIENISKGTNIMSMIDKKLEDLVKSKIQQSV